MRPSLVFFAAALVCCGCTTNNLKRYTVNQSMSLLDLRYQQVMDNLADIKCNQGKLPALALTGSGTTTVSNTFGWDATTGWTILGFATQTMNLSGKHAPAPQWQIEPMSDELSLRAARAACLWVACGSSVLSPGEISLLGKASEDEIYGTVYLSKTETACGRPVAHYRPSTAPSAHFDILDSLSQLPAGWLKCGRRCDVPKCACYSSGCCGEYIWVEPEEMSGLSDFTLILMDIATRDSTTVYAKPASVSIDISIQNDICQPKPAGAAHNTFTKVCKVAKIADVTMNGRTRYMAVAGVHYGPAMPSDDEVIGHGYVLPDATCLNCTGSSVEPGVSGKDPCNSKNNGFLGAADLPCVFSITTPPDAHTIEATMEFSPNGLYQWAPDSSKPDEKTQYGPETSAYLHRIHLNQEDVDVARKDLDRSHDSRVPVAIIPMDRRRSASGY